MAEKREQEKTLEMRVAELEDKLKGLQVTEEELKAFNKVAAMMGGVTGAVPPVAAASGESPALTAAPTSCIIQQCVRPCTVIQCVRSCTIVWQCVRQCTVLQCTVMQCTIRACTIEQCINECGGGAPGIGGFIGGGGFQSLGG